MRTAVSLVSSTPLLEIAVSLPIASSTRPLGRMIRHSSSGSRRVYQPNWMPLAIAHPSRASPAATGMALGTTEPDIRNISRPIIVVTKPQFLQ